MFVIHTEDLYFLNGHSDGIGEHSHRGDGG